MNDTAFASPMLRLHPTFRLGTRSPSDVNLWGICASSTPNGDVYIVGDIHDINDSPMPGGPPPVVYHYSADKNTISLLQCSVNKLPPSGGSSVIIGQLLVYVSTPDIYMLNLGKWFSCLIL